jgi:hypothetical protein
MAGKGLVMWPDAGVEEHLCQVQIAGLRSDSEHLRWFAANPTEVKQLPGGKWRYRDIEGGIHETSDLITALVIAKDAARIRALHAAREG